jgi:hypothetical protein
VSRVRVIEMAPVSRERPSEGERLAAAALVDVIKLKVEPVPVRVGSIVEVDRSHLPVARSLPPERRKYAGKVLEVHADSERPGWLYARLDSAKAGVVTLVGIPPVGSKHADGRGPKVRVIRW